MTAILGISAFYHDSAAALVVDGEIVAAAQEERFSRLKHDARLPVHAIEYCLSEAGLEPAQLDYVGYYEKPLLKFDRLLETYLSYAPAGFRSFAKASPLWLKEKLRLPRELDRGLGHEFKKRYIFLSHHMSHAASAFYPSPFDEAAILTLDGVGEWATATYGRGSGHEITLSHELKFPHSLGLLYSAFTYYCGFRVNSGEYKLMGLAPYGQPVYADLIRERLMDLKDDGSFRLDMAYFNYCQGLTMTSPKFHDLFGAPPRRPESDLDPLYMDVAASIQSVTEDVMLRAVRHLHAETGMKNLCLAGGVALNCVGNGRILREGPFEQIWIQPAAGDAGGALGAAQYVWHQLLGHPRKAIAGDSQRYSQLGPSFDDEDIRRHLEATGAAYERVDGDDEVCRRIARAMADGKIVGWFQSRMEFGPRALGCRSIVADARHPKMQELINKKVKFREGFRPFAPSVLVEHAPENFDMRPGESSPYMLLVFPVHEAKRLPMPESERGLEGLDKLRQTRSVIPAVTHVNYSARVQTVEAGQGLYRKLIEEFHRLTGSAVIVNTSFNLAGDPIVRTPKEAIDTFMSSDIDVLCMGRTLVRKEAQRGYVQPAAGEEPGPVLGEILESPCHGAELRFDGGQATCAECGHAFGKTDDVWQLFWPHDDFGSPRDVTERVEAFYNETPFPDYDDHDSLRSLIDKSRRGMYARALERAIPYNSTVLDLGCGTGQLSNFLGIACRRVVGADLCLNSLRLGEAFRAQYNLSRVRFLQMNVFRPCFKKGAFDVVLCNGVLHHTADPLGGFRSLVPLVKPGGWLVIGLYNRWGRLATDLRRGLFRLTGGRAQWIDPFLRAPGKMSAAKRRAWFADQYRHPHESKHTFGEVLDWFDASQVDFVRAVPSTLPSAERFDEDRLFEPQARGTAFDHLLVQAREVVTGSREGGFFLMIGRRREAPGAGEMERERGPQAV